MSEWTPVKLSNVRMDFYRIVTCQNGYINDMFLNIDYYTDMYADDTTITITGKTIQVLEDKFQNDVYNIVYWCRRNNMRINVMKTKVMLITTNRRTSMLPNKILEVKNK